MNERYRLMRRGAGCEIHSAAGCELVFDSITDGRRHLRNHGYVLVRAHPIDDPTPHCEHWWLIQTAEQRAAAHRYCYDRYVPEHQRIPVGQALAQLIRLVIRDGWDLMHTMWMQQPDIFWYAYSPYFVRLPGQSKTCLIVEDR